MKNIPLAKDHGTVGKRCASHPYEYVDVEYADFYGFLNVWFGGQGSMYDTEETFNAGHWYELPVGKTTTEAEVEKINEFISDRTIIFKDVYFEDETHIFFS